MERLFDVITKQQDKFIKYMYKRYTAAAVALVNNKHVPRTPG